MNAYLDKDNDLWVERDPGKYVCAGSESRIREVLEEGWTGKPLEYVRCLYGPLKATTVREA